MHEARRSPGGHLLFAHLKTWNGFYGKGRAIDGRGDELLMADIMTIEFLVGRDSRKETHECCESRGAKDFG